MSSEAKSASAPGAQPPLVKPVEAIDYQVSPAFVGLLERLGCSLIISNYQSGTVMTFSGLGDGKPMQMFAPFQAAMGLALEGDRLAVSTKTEVILLTNLRSLAPSFPKYPGLFDGYLAPRTRYITGECALHDLAFDGAAILAVNTNYSCICRIDGMRNFEPVWTPPFISEIRPGDRCHLNGMALQEGQVRFATALGSTDRPRGWTQDKLTGGVLLEVPSGRVVADGLCMPHSPRLIDGKLYVVEAGTGTLLVVDPVTGMRTPVITLPGFARGVAAHGGYLFVGLSLVRESLGFKDLPIERSSEELICGVAAIELATGEIVGTLRYIGGCSEIHDIQVMPGVRRLGISGCDSDTTKLAIDLPDIGFWIDPTPENPGPEQDNSRHLV